MHHGLRWGTGGREEGGACEWQCHGRGGTCAATACHACAARLIALRRPETNSVQAAGAPWRQLTRLEAAGAANRPGARRAVSKNELAARGIRAIVHQCISRRAPCHLDLRPDVPVRVGLVRERHELVRGHHGRRHAAAASIVGVHADVRGVPGSSRQALPDDVEWDAGIKRADCRGRGRAGRGRAGQHSESGARMGHEQELMYIIIFMVLCVITTRARLPCPPDP